MSEANYAQVNLRILSQKERHQVLFPDQSNISSEPASEDAKIATS